MAGFHRACTAKLPVTLVALGGSISAGATASVPSKRWANQLAEWIEVTYEVDVTLIMAGIGQTGADYGALRIDRDVPKDGFLLVVVDEAINSPQSMFAALEGMLRKLIARPNMSIISTMFCNGSGQGFQDGQAPIAQHYNLPIVSYRDGVLPLIQAGTYTWAQLCDDTVHPNDTGHLLEFGFMRDFILASRAAFDSSLLPPPIYQHNMERTGFVSGQAAMTALAKGPQSYSFGWWPPAAALGTNVVWDYVDVLLDLAGDGDVWVVVLDSAGAVPAGEWGTLATFLDPPSSGGYGTLLNVHDCNAPQHTNGQIVVVKVAAGLSGSHVLRFVNWPSGSGSAGNNIWLYGVGYST